jgi:hypothetical protein
MRKNAFARHGKRAAARLRAIRRRAANWKRRARQGVTLALIAATTAGVPSIADAQMGQMGMAPATGLGNRAAAAFKGLNENGPGVLYYGINAADRGLGYQGSYMTLGGYVPYGEDGLGGLWAADLRSHLSVYGGFFSNVGAVRKQFLGGSLLGIGIYWDYDGDLNQYSDTTITDGSGSYLFDGGQVYNQVGISGEWLTDFGNIRSNGYIPVGSTGQTMSQFVGNSLLCTPGINAALTGTDLEVGAYIPGLNDWAGMISVGGYAYGNSRYDLANGQDAVPWFGGVYTRLDMTLIENWDFSLQYNNDSYFDSTGFARLTYRMGGSRRRNVPDQMEQPMMRNEHIVRAHQAPEQAINPYNVVDGKAQPWRVIHVDNSATDAPTGNGTTESAYTTLEQAQAAATNAYDIVFVHQGNSQNSPYSGEFAFQNDNQILVGQGSQLAIPTVDCGFLSLNARGSDSTSYPILSNPLGTSVHLTNGGSRNNTVDHLQIVGSQVAIDDGSGMQEGGIATVNDVIVIGTSAGQTGVVIRDLASGGNTFNFTNMQLSNLTADGFVIDGQSVGGSAARVNISSSSIENTSGSAVVVNDVTGAGRVRLANSSIDGTTSAGVTVSGGKATIEAVTMSRIGTAGVNVVAKPFINPPDPLITSGTSTVQVVDSTITATIGVQAASHNVDDVINLTVNKNILVAPSGGNGINLAVDDGKINTSIVGNVIRTATTTAIATGTAGGINNPAPVASGIYLTTLNTGTGLNNLTVKAVNADNLRALNTDATVTTSPQQNPIITGTTPAPVPPPPPPPNYDPSVVVPLPPG